MRDRRPRRARDESAAERRWTGKGKWEIERESSESKCGNCRSVRASGHWSGNVLGRRRSECAGPARTSSGATPARSRCRDSPLERALARNVITQEQYAAGQKYRHHWYPPASTTRSDRSTSPGSSAPTSAPFPAWRRRKPALPSAKISGSGASHRQDRLARARLGGVPGNRARAGRLLAGLDQPATGYAAAAERMKIALDELCRLWGIGSAGEHP